MERTCTSILLIFLSFSLFSQDYCPCEDQTYGEEEPDFLSYTSSTDFFMDFSKQETTTITYSLVIVEEEPETDKFEDEPLLAESGSIENEAPIRAPSAKRTKARHPKVKGSTWKTQRKLKRKRKFKKYSGRCPVF